MSGRPVGNPYLRVSDAERQEVADILKQHAADGRLDTAEFEGRLDRALRAKTRADLAGLLDDLPDLNPARAAGYRPGPYGYGRGRYDMGPYGPPPAPRPFLWTLVTVGLVLAAFFATLSAISTVAHPHFFWLVALIAVAALWRRSHGHRRWRA